MDYLSLLLGLAGLWYGTELTIRGAVTVASRLGVSDFIVGVAILSIGSDLPELAIAIDGAVINLRAGDASDVIVGTAIGSSLGQIGFVLGTAALLSYLTLPRSVVFQHGSVLLGSALLLGIFGLMALCRGPRESRYWSSISSTLRRCSVIGERVPARTGWTG